MNKRQAFISSILLLSALIVVGVARAEGTPTVDWCVISGGGGHMEAAPYSLDTTIGQPVVGAAADTSVEICSGFWCGVGAVHTVYLPLVIKNA